MSNARPNKVLSISENSWSKLDTHLNEQAENVQIHCRIPLCVGFKEEKNGKQLQAIVHGIEARGYEYTIYLSPKDDESLEAWRAQNHEYLATIDTNKIQDIREWRNTRDWNRAKEQYATLRVGEKADSVKKMIDTDVDNFSKRHKEVPTDEIEAHVLAEVHDVVSWMSLQGTKDKVNVLIYDHGVTQAMRNAIQNASAMGFECDSIFHVKYKLGMIEAKPVLVSPQPKMHNVYNRAENINAPHADSKLDITAIVLTILAQKAEDPQYFATFIKSLNQSGQHGQSAQAEHSGGRELYQINVPMPVGGELVSVDVVQQSKESHRQERASGRPRSSSNVGPVSQYTGSNTLFRPAVAGSAPLPNSPINSPSFGK